MEFYEISSTDRVSEGEYVFHIPSETVVLCGEFSRTANNIIALSNGKLLEDTIDNFKKISMPKKAAYRTKAHRRCGGCKG